MNQSSIIILGDFAENNAFVVQNKKQGYHWNTQYISYCFASDDITHDETYVYKIFQLTIPILKKKIPNLSKLHLFVDGCAGQYKSFNSFYHLCQLKSEFALKVEWNLFATSYGKSLCNGIGGTVKRLTAQESLKRLTETKFSPQKLCINFLLRKSRLLTSFT